MTDSTVDTTEFTLYKFTNKDDSPYLDTLLQMFYEGAFGNTIGIMEAFNLKTQEEETILVGVSVDEDGKPECFPIAKLMSAEDVPNYLSPDGMGGFFDPLDPVARAEAKENMVPVGQAIVETEV